MSLAEQTTGSLVRAIAIATLAVSAAVPLRDFLATASRRSRSVAWPALLAAFLTPALLVSYAYSAFVLSLIREPGLAALIYSALLWMKLTPIAVLVLHFAPSPMTSEALHCRRLLGSRPFLESLIFHARAAGRSPVVAFALVFLFAFDDFELASLWSVKTWAVAVFDAQAGGLPHAASLRLSLAPILIEAGVVIFVFALIARDGLPVSPAHRRVARAKWKHGFSVAYLAISTAALTIVPVVLVFKNAVSGAASLFQNFALGGDIAASLLFATGAACCVSFAARAVSKPLLSCALALPGLLGALPVSLVVVAVFQLPALRPFYDTPLPLLIALTFMLLPFALLLRALLRAIRPGAALHLATLLRSRQLVWELQTRSEFWIAFLLFCWAFFDLTASAIAAPIGMTPVFVRLHNLMHYGQTAVLSAMLCAALLTAALVPVLPLAARAIYSRTRRSS